MLPDVPDCIVWRFSPMGRKITHASLQGVLTDSEVLQELLSNIYRNPLWNIPKGDFYYLNVLNYLPVSLIFFDYQQNVLALLKLRVFRLYESVLRFWKWWTETGLVVRSLLKTIGASSFEMQERIPYIIFS